MPGSPQAALESWTRAVPLDLVLILAAWIYLRGWSYLRRSRVNMLPAWRAGSFVLSLFLIWLALASRLSDWDEQSLTIHMVQHLLLMTFAPPLLLLGAPAMPFLHGLPRRFVHSSLAPAFRYPPLQRVGRMFVQPAFCWLASVAALVGWHFPAAFTLALQSETWHVVEHSSFLAGGFLFWWPVIQPWPSVPHWTRWSMLLYLFFATLPCDILSAYLTFCERVVYSVYLNTPRPFGISALADQECAGALMWTCVTLVYLVAGAVLTMQVLTARTSAPQQSLPSALPAIPAAQAAEAHLLDGGLAG